MALTIESEVFEAKPVFDFVKIIKKMIRFLFYRVDITPCKIDIYLSDRKGSIYSNRDLEYALIEEDYISNYSDAINWNTCYLYIGKIIEALLTENLYMLHIPNNLKGRLGISNNDIANISSAFENVYCNLFPIRERKKERRIAEDNIKIRLKDLLKESHGIEKDILRYLLNSVGHDSLETKLNDAFKKYDIYIKWLKLKLFPKKIMEQFHNFFQCVFRLM